MLTKCTTDLKPSKLNLGEGVFVVYSDHRLKNYQLLQKNIYKPD